MTAFQLDREGRFLQCEGKYQFRDALALSLTLDLFSGQDSSYYGRWRQNNRFTSTLEYSF